jgi:hypothetical protein
VPGEQIRGLPGRDHRRSQPPRVATDHDQHRRPAHLPEPQRHVRRREPQITLREFARQILGALRRIRRATNNGRNCRTRSLNTVIDRCQPTRSASTVVGIDGHSDSNARICGSTASTIDGFAGREYDGGPSAANARRTVFRPTPSLRAIALIGIPSAR